MTQPPTTPDLPEDLPERPSFPDVTIPPPPEPPTPPTPAPSPPAPLTPPGPPLNPPQGAVYGRAANRRNLLGYLSLAFGIIGTGCCCCPWLNGAPFIGGIPAIILGVMHLTRAAKGQAGQKWLGWVGIALGVIAILGAICGLTTDLDTRITDEYNQFVDN